METLKEGGAKKFLKEMIDINFPNLMKTLGPHIQESQWTSSTRNMTKSTPGYILIKLWRSMRENSTYRGTKVRINPEDSEAKSFKYGKKEKKNCLLIIWKYFSKTNVKIGKEQSFQQMV